MDVPDNLTEYKRQFQWNLPMVEPKPPKPEPILTQYQLAYGHGTNHHPNSTESTTHNSSPNYSRQSSNEQTDSSSYKVPPQKASSRTSDEAFLDFGPPPVNRAPVRSSAVLFSYEQPPRSPSPIEIPKQSEYHAKFKPFNDYVYVEGVGFKKQTLLTAAQKAKLAKSWVCEVEERTRQACKYRARSQNG